MRPTATSALIQALVQRAGGGHGSGGGGSSGGGFSGGGFHTGGGFYGGTGGDIGGAIVVVVIIVALVGFRFMRRGRGGAGIPMMPSPDVFQRSRWIDQSQGVATPFPGPPEHSGGLDAIRAHDPAFDETAFLGEAQRAFFIIEEAWMQRQPEMAHAVMAEVLWQQHKAQIEGYISAGKTNVLEDLTVSNMTITSAGSDQSWDTIQLRVSAACADYDRDDRTGKIIRGNRTVTPWQEDWTFQRPSSAKTEPNAAAPQSHCTNCGAPLETNFGGNCTFCGAPVTGSPNGWKLVRIAQIGF